MTKIFQDTICFCFLITKAGSVITDDGLALTPKGDMIKIIKRSRLPELPEYNSTPSPMICNILQTSTVNCHNKACSMTAPTAIISVSHLLYERMRNGHGCGTVDYTIEVAEITCWAVNQPRTGIASSSPGDPLILIGRERRAMCSDRIERS
jgi:hypothetical protein